MRSMACTIRFLDAFSIRPVVAAQQVVLAVEFVISFSYVGSDEWEIDLLHYLFPSVLFQVFFFSFLFIYEWEHRTYTLCPLSSLHPLRNGKERQ